MKRAIADSASGGPGDPDLERNFSLLLPNTWRYQPELRLGFSDIGSNSVSKGMTERGRRCARLRGKCLM